MNDRLASFGDWRNLLAAFAAISVFGFAFGMTYPLLSLILDARGVTEELIGINAAMAPIGVLLSSSIIPVAARKFGSRNVAIVAAALTALLIISFKVFDRLDVWFILRLIQGVSISTLFVLSESWIVKYSDGAKRGRIVAVYGAILSASFGAGPALVSVIGIEGWLPFIIGACVIIIGIIPLLFVRDDIQPAPHEKQTSTILSFIPKAPMLLLAVAMFAIFDAATLSLLPVYGVKVGLSLTTATNVLTALIVGNIVLQFPIGMLADRFPKRSVLTACAAVTAVTCLILPPVMGTLWMWPVIIIMGATGYGMYTVALAALGDRFTGDELVTGNAAFASMWGSGALIGAVIGGWGMAGFGPHGLLYVLFAAFALFLAAMAVRASTLR
ncbi:MAG: MFS transporter [Aestuariivirgaceae bacterium]